MNNNEKKKNTFYPDRLSLIDKDPSALTQYSKRTINEYAVERLYNFAQVNPIQFRRMWLLFQFQDYRVEMDFATANKIVKKYVANSGLGARNTDNIIAANRRQILGVIREQKIREFLKYYNNIFLLSEGTFDIFSFAANAPIEELLIEPLEIDFFSDNNVIQEPKVVKSIHKRRYKLPKEIWDLILNPTTDISLLSSINIDLPRTEKDDDKPTVDLSSEFGKHIPSQPQGDLNIDGDDIDSIFAFFES